MADEQSNIANEQLPIYDKAVEAQKGTSDDKQSSAPAEGTATSAKIDAPQPPASNPGADDATGGISEGAGGLSSTAHIESPVPNQDQSLFSTVKNMLGFGSTEEVKAEDKGPAEDATTAPSSSLLAGSTIAAPVAAAAGAVTGSSIASSHNTTTTSAPTTSSTTGASSTSASAAKGTYLDYQQASTSDNAAFPSSQTLPIRSTPGGTLSSENTTTSSTAAAKTDTAPTSTESSKTEENKNTSTSDDSENKMGEAGKKEERTDPGTEKPPQPADGKPSKGLENKDAIPTAGGKTLGQEHWGESDIVPDDPGAKKETDATTKDNTAKNAGAPPSEKSEGKSGEKGEGKEKFVDKIKDKLHIGKK